MKKYCGVNFEITSLRIYTRLNHMLLFAGKVRKLTMMTFTTIGKKDENEENHPKLKVSTTNQNLGGKAENNISVSSSPETYSGDLDIGGMDYSLAIRKPPIHN
ncbi:polyphenol oxidase A [Striga asiatica]|uniref:Polyphenol oxidase A n=1 Tax=Striga asiatica TaxID=4170 RepID=A0A5A7PWL9_STRAF|nr:polyphenol oxidase A [Striga asiatica]